MRKFASRITTRYTKTQLEQRFDGNIVTVVDKRHPQYGEIKDLLEYFGSEELNKDYEYRCYRYDGCLSGFLNCVTWHKGDI